MVFGELWALGLELRGNGVWLFGHCQLSITDHSFSRHLKISIIVSAFGHVLLTASAYPIAVVLPCIIGTSNSAGAPTSSRIPQIENVAGKAYNQVIVTRKKKTSFCRAPA